IMRRWRLIMIALGLALCLNLAPAIYFGFGRNTELIRTWYAHVIQDQQFHEINGPINLSLKGQLVRSLTRVDYSQRIDGDTKYPGVNFADYSYSDVAGLWLPLDVLIIALGFGLIAWPGRNDGRDGAMLRRQSPAREPGTGSTIAAGNPP